MDLHEEGRIGGWVYMGLNEGMGGWQAEYTSGSLDGCRKTYGDRKKTGEREEQGQKEMKKGVGRRERMCRNKAVR